MIGHGNITLDDHHRERPVGQFLFRVWAAFQVLLGCPFVLAGVLLVVPPSGWLHVAAGTLVVVGGGWWIRYHLAGWRCVRRYRKPWKG